MTDAYYYFYYLAVVFFKKINQRPERLGSDNYSNGWIIVGLLTGLNAISIFIAVAPKVTPKSGYFVGIPVMAINYYFLARGNRGKKIFEEYNDKFNASSKKKLIITVAILYALATLALTAYVVVSYRLNHHRSSS
jgi:hypothetical protein